VLGLYRQFMHNIFQRPEGPEREALLKKVREEFKMGAKVSRFEVDSIERRLTRGRKELKLLMLPGTVSVHTVGPPVG